MPEPPRFYTDGKIICLAGTVEINGLLYGDGRVGSAATDSLATLIVALLNRHFELETPDAR